MDIRQALLAGHSRRQTMAIVAYIGDDADRFAALMTQFFAGDYRLTQRAAWPMNYCAEQHPQLILPYLTKLVACLERDDMHVAVRRNVLRLLQYSEIPRRLAGRIYATCIDLIDDAFEPIAVRVFAMSVAARIAGQEPDLLDELRLVVQKHLPHATAAFKVRARRILKADQNAQRDPMLLPADDWLPYQEAPDIFRQGKRKPTVRRSCRNAKPFRHR